MSLRIVESSVAIAEANAIALYLADASTLEDGRRFLRSVQAAYQRLAEMPGIGATRTYPSSALGEMRIWPVPKFSKYLIFYRVLGSDLEILRILHGAQNLDAIFASSDDT